MKNYFSNLKACFNNDTGGCGWDELKYFFNDILKSLIVIGMFVAAIMISYAGWVLLSGQGSPTSRSKAKKIFITVVGGMVLLLGAYFIVDLILRGVGFNDRAGFIQ